MKREKVPDWLVRTLRGLPRVSVTHEAGTGLVRLTTSDGPEAEYEVVPRAFLSSPEAERFSETLRHWQLFPERLPLLAVRQLAPETRRELADRGMSWVEERTGFVNLVAPHLYVHAQAAPGPGDTDDARREPARSAERQHRSARPTRLTGLSGRCVEALLLRYSPAAPTADSGAGVRAGGAGKDGATVITATRLAEAAGVSTPMALHVLRRLASEGAVEAAPPVEGDHRPRALGGEGRPRAAWLLRDPGLALDLWAREEQATRGREVHAYVWARSPRELLVRLTELTSSLRAWAVGGVAAANLYAPTLTADPAPVVWVPADEPLEPLVHRLGGNVVPDGANLVLRQVRGDPWALYARRLGHASETGAHRRALAGEHGPPAPGRDAEATPWAAPPPKAEQLPPLYIVSRPRAYVEAHRTGRGRDGDVADALLASTSRAPRLVARAP